MAAGSGSSQDRSVVVGHEGLVSVLTAVAAALFTVAVLSLAAPLEARAANDDDPPSIDRMDATRSILSHGRIDRVRAAGVAAGLPEAGSPIDFVRHYRNLPGITDTPWFEGPATVLEPIAGNPMISLDDDGDGKADLENAYVQARRGCRPRSHCWSPRAWSTPTVIRSAWSGGCHREASSMPPSELSGLGSIPFPDVPVDQSQTFEFDAFLSDSTPVGGNCRVRYVYEYSSGE